MLCVPLFALVCALFVVNSVAAQDAGSSAATPPCASGDCPPVPGTDMGRDTEARADEAREVVEISGVRITQGDAVECPTIQDDAGRIHPVSYLSPAIPIGGRVSVRGFYAVTTKCLGTVLVVEDEQKE